ncbi:unnamed protein product, partial [Heterotrigona itama]
IEFHAFNFHVCCHAVDATKLLYLVPDEVSRWPSQYEQGKDKDTLKSVYKVEGGPVERVPVDEPGYQFHHPVEAHQREHDHANDRGAHKTAQVLPVEPIGLLISRQTPQVKIPLVFRQLDENENEKQHVAKEQQPDR